MRTGGVGIGTLLSLVLAAGTAYGEESRSGIALRWQAPDECPDDLAMLRHIEGFLGEPLAQAREQQLAIDAHVMGDAAHGYAAKVSFTTATGTSERAMEHADCRKLTEAAALLMALAIDPDRVRALQQASGTRNAKEAEPNVSPPPAAALHGQAPREPPRAVPARPVVQSQEPARRERALHFNLSVLGFAAQGILPSVSPGLGLELAGRIGPFELALGGRSWASRTAPVPGAPGVGVDLSLMTAGLRLCGVPTRDRWSLLACARGDLGQMSGDGQHVDDARTGHDLFAGLGGSLGVAYAVGRFSPRAGAELTRTVARPRFGVLRDEQEIQAFRPKLWQLTGFVGLAYEL